MAAADGTGTTTLAVAPATQLQRLYHSAGVTLMDSASALYIEKWDNFRVERASKSDLELAGDGKVTRACTGLWSEVHAQKQ